MTRASIVIVAYGQRALTEQCLRSLEACLGDRLGREFELVLVDNGSPDDTAELLAAWSDRATVRLLGENRNFAGGCNAGAEAARGEVLVFLNNDTEVTPGALEALVDQALEPGVGAAGCRLLFPDGTHQHAGVAFLRGRALGGASMPQHVFHHTDQELAAARGSYELDCVTAACCAVRTGTFRQLGGFDETYRNGLEDVDLCLRIREAGERIVYRGDVTVIHHEGASRGKGGALWATAAKAETMRHNDLTFVERWATELDQDDELAAHLWDAALSDHPPARTEQTADLVLLGQPGAIGPAGDEARALLAALTAHGRVVAAADWPVPNVVPRLSPALAATLALAQRRSPRDGAALVLVPAGAHDRQEFVPGATVRLAQRRAALPLEQAGQIWTTTPALAETLVSDGLSAERIRVVAPVVLPAAAGDGGAGVLAVLPVHDPPRAGGLLDALRSLDRATPVRLLPTVRGRKLETEVAERLPGAELLGPCSDEARFAALAADADVVVALDPSDRFERRALVAAGVGAAVITDVPDGPAVSVLGAGALIAGDPQALARVLAAAIAEPGDRGARRRAVAERCSPEALPGHLATEFAATT